VRLPGYIETSRLGDHGRSHASRTDLVVTGMIVIGACGFITDRIIVAVSNRLLAWSPQHHA